MVLLESIKKAIFFKEILKIVVEKALVEYRTSHIFSPVIFLKILGRSELKAGNTHEEI